MARTFKLGDGFVIAITLRQKNNTQVAEQLTSRGLISGGLLVLRHGFVYFALPVKNITQVVVGHPTAGIGGDGVDLKRLQVLINPGPLPAHHPKNQQQSGTKAGLPLGVLGKDSIRPPG